MSTSVPGMAGVAVWARAEDGVTSMRHGYAGGKRVKDGPS